MAELTGWRQSTRNIGRTGWAGETGGIPGSKPAWRAFNKGTLLADTCMTADAVYVLCGLTTAAWDARDGRPLWQATSEPSNRGTGIALSEGYCGAGYLILNRGTGEMVADFRRAIGHADIGRYSDVMRHNGGFVREIHAPRHGLYWLSPETEQGAFLTPEGLFDPYGFSFFHQGLMYGRRGARYFCHDPATGEERWALELPMAKDGKPMMPDDHPALWGDRLYFHLNYDTLWCVDALTGAVIWKRGPDHIEANETPWQCQPPSGPRVCEDALYLTRTRSHIGFIQQFDTRSGAPGWRVEVREGKEPCIVGDLLFGTEGEALVAWDRYTGEQVWQAADRMVAAYHVMAAGDRVVYTNTVGEIRCYRWEKPYASPARGR